jgi:MFS family permease
MGSSGSEVAGAASAHASPREALTLVPRPFAVYTAAVGITDLAAGFARLALPWLMFSLTHSAFVLGLTAFAQMAASWTSPALGVVADRIDRRAALVVGYALRAAAWTAVAALCLAPPAGVRPTWLAAVLALALLERMAAILVTQAGAVIRRVLTPARARLGMNTWQFTVFNVAYYLSPALAGVVIGRYGADTALALTAVANVAVLAFALKLPSVPAAPAVPAAPGRTRVSLARDFADGVRILRAHAVLIWLAAFGFFYNGVWAGVTAVAVALYRADLHLGATAVGLISLAAGALTTAVGLLTPRLARHLTARALLALTVGISGVGMAAMGLARSWPIVTAGLTLLEVPATPWMVLTATIAQARIPKDAYGRVNALRATLSQGGTPLGALGGGVLAAAIGVRADILLLAAVSFAGVAALPFTPLWRVVWPPVTAEAVPVPALAAAPAPAAATAPSARPAPQGDA